MRYSKLVVPLSLPLALLAVAALAAHTFAADAHPTAGGIGEPLSPLGKEWKPPLKPASDEGERAMVRFKLAPGLKVSLWAAEPMLANPNAICTDEKGRIYVAETYRYRGGVLDIRDFLTGPRAMLEQDIAARTVEDRVAMVRKTLGADADKLAVDHDRIVLLEDADGDGKADKSTIFSDGYNRIEDGLGSGVFAYKGNVYYTNVPCLWLLKDTNNDSRADQRTCLQYGYGVRYAYLGHDLHGMVLGPDGKLYFSMGDRGLNVTKTPDDVTVENPDSGAVLRCNLDGTGLELFATGLRNPQELRFDQHGNLFTGDNNPDKGDPARWVYVVEGGDSGWRIGYQHGERPRDGGPWMAEQIWQTEPYNNNFYIVPHLSHIGAGPSGLAYYPGTGLPDRYQDTFFLCEFRGGSGNSGVWAIKNRQKGAGFVPVSVEGKPLNKDSDLARNSLIHGILVTDIEFGVDGGAYLSDWTEGWERPMKGRIYRVFDEKAARTPVVMETKKLIGEGVGGKSVGDLVELLSHPDMRIRQEAQFALAGKGQDAVAALSQAARGKEQTLPRLHAIWGLGQAAARAPEVLEPLVPLVKDNDLEVRCQAAKVLGDGRVEKAFDHLLGMLKDPEARARFFAAMALGKIGKAEAVAPILNVLKENADKDGHLRHACVQALAWIGEAEPLVEAAKHESPSVRLGAVLALRKMQHGDVAAFLQDADRVVLLEAARAIHDVPIEFAMEQLAAVADQALPKSKGFAEKPVGFTPATTGGVNDWILWRAMNANYRLGTPEGAQRLAKLAANDAVPTAIRVEALRDLGDWETPPGRDRIMNLWRPMAPGRDARAARDAAAGVVEELAKDSKTPNAVRVAATNLMRQLGLGDPATLAATVEDAKAAPEVRVAALASLVASKDQRYMMKAIEAALKDKDPSLRREATRALANVPGGVKRITDLLERGSVADKQAALAALGASPGSEADPLLAQWMDRLIANQVQPELQLDLLEAAEARATPAVKEKLAQHKAAVRDPKDPLSYYRETLAGGDAEVGRRIFRENAAVSCMRCHAAEGEGGIVGPKMDGLATRQNREYILESIVAPNAKIAEGFETVVVQTKDTPPRYRTGVLKKEDDKELVLMNPDAEADQQLITIPKDNIATRERGPSAMPEGLVKALSKRELRDLVEYLANRKEPAK